MLIERRREVEAARMRGVLSMLVYLRQGDALARFGQALLSDPMNVASVVVARFIADSVSVCVRVCLSRWPFVCAYVLGFSLRMPLSGACL